MEEKQTGLQRQILSGKPLLLTEISPPQGSDPTAVQALARRFAGKVHAVGVCDNRDRVSMSAMAAATLIAADGVEPILHQVTRDRNRIAMISEILGAQALGIRNLLCTSGTHQALEPFHAARNVFDLDPVQLLQTYTELASNGKSVGEKGIAGAGPFCLGAVAAPYADPMELQVLRLAKKVRAGAQFLITQPIFDLERFGLWWEEVTRRGLHEKTAIVAGVQPLSDAKTAEELATKRPKTWIPADMLARMAAGANAAAQRATGIAIALETIRRLEAFKGLRGFQVFADGDTDAVLEVIDKAALGIQ
jgi:methylenetetrahydrofolate reductase (NADPH)